MAKNTDALRAGQQIGPWTLQRRLGAGEFSAVWSATRANLDDEYALKISAVPPKTKGRRKKNAQAEGSTLLHWEYQLYTGYVGGKRGHAGIPRTPARPYYGTHDGFRYLALELLGPTLASLAPPVEYHAPLAGCCRRVRGKNKPAWRRKTENDILTLIYK